MSDYQLADTIYKKFTTRSFSTGAPTTLSGTPVISIYENDSLTQITAGITLTVDFDAVTGLNHVTIVATGANGFESGKYYSGVITTGTVGGVSVVGETVFEFSLDASAASKQLTAGVQVASYASGQAPLQPTVAGRTLDVTTGGTAGIDWANIESPTTSVTFSNTTIGTVTSNTDMRGTDSALLAASAPTNWSSLVISGAGAVDSLTQGFIDSTLTENTVGRITGNFDTFFENADAATVKVVDDVGGGVGTGDWTTSEKNEIRGRLGITGTTAAGGNTPTLATQSSVDVIDTNVDAILVDTGTTLPAQISALNDISATDVWAAATRTLTAGTNIVLAKGVGITGFNDISTAQVNAEVVDVMFTDTYAEPSSVPGATSSISAKINWVFALSRNKLEQTSTAQTLRNDGDVGDIASSIVSDDGTTFTRGKFT